MIVIVLSVCMIQDAGKCKDINLNFMAEHVTPQQCMMYGQSEIAKWMEGHPNWRIARWSCGRAGQLAKA